MTTILYCRTEGARDQRFVFAPMIESEITVTGQEWLHSGPHRCTQQASYMAVQHFRNAIYGEEHKRALDVIYSLGEFLPHHQKITLHTALDHFKNAFDDVDFVDVTDAFEDTIFGATVNPLQRIDELHQQCHHWRQQYTQANQQAMLYSQELLDAEDAERHYRLLYSNRLKQQRRKHRKNKKGR